MEVEVGHCHKARRGKVLHGLAFTFDYFWGTAHLGTKEIDNSNPIGPTVMEVKRGAVDDFNQLNPLRTIQLHDLIVQVGEVKGAQATIGDPGTRGRRSDL